MATCFSIVSILLKLEFMDMFCQEKVVKVAVKKCLSPFCLNYFSHSTFLTDKPDFIPSLIHFLFMLKYPRMTAVGTFAHLLWTGALEKVQKVTNFK